MLWLIRRPPDREDSHPFFGSHCLAHNSGLIKQAMVGWKVLFQDKLCVYFESDFFGSRVPQCVQISDLRDGIGEQVFVRARTLGILHVCRLFE